MSNRILYYVIGLELFRKSRAGVFKYNPVLDVYEVVGGDS